MVSTRIRVKAIPALVATGLLSTFPAMHKVAAQQGDDQSTPVASPEVSEAWADLGLPELNLTFTPDALEGVPESLEAGRYRLTIGGEAGPEDYALAPLIMQLPEGLSLEDAVAQAAENPDAPPAFYYESVLAGGSGAVVPAGQTSATSVIDLTPGEWVVTGQAMSRPPVMLTVTGEMPSELPEPEATVVVEMGEMYFTIQEGEFVGGENLVRVDNAGAQPHFVEFMKIPDGSTKENVEAAIQAEMGGTPESEPLDFSQVMPAGYISEQSAGVTAWAAVTLDPGTYAIMCWVADPETGIPHAMSGMYDVVVIEN